MELLNYSKGALLSMTIPDWPVCGNCREVAYFRWMGDPHACGGPDTTQVLTVKLEERSRYLRCGTGRSLRTIKSIVIDGKDLKHLVRYMERIHDDDEIAEVRVQVRADGTLQFSAADFIYSAAVGYTEPDSDEPW